jgi:glyoxylase-like metal-dependent hydrolase (beta-lactamase superfamily II)
VVGPGALGLLSGATKLENGSYSHFEADLLSYGWTVELPGLPSNAASKQDKIQGVVTEVDPTQGDAKLDLSWLCEPFAEFPATIDIFGDGSIRIVNAPGHLLGHINLIYRISKEPERFVYLAGRACHDRRLLTREKSIAEWRDAERPHIVCCIHAGRRKAEETMERMRRLELGKVEKLGAVKVVFAHDTDWEKKARQERRFWPGRL